MDIKIYNINNPTDILNCKIVSNIFNDGLNKNLKKKIYFGNLIVGSEMSDTYDIKDKTLDKIQFSIFHSEGNNKNLFTIKILYRRFKFLYKKY